MKTILITGHDLDIGKTWVTRFIAKKLIEGREFVQVVKPVETGIDIGSSLGDVSRILENLSTEFLSGFTLNSFKAPLAPLAAADLEGERLSIKKIVKNINALPATDWRLIETAGGLAVPLDESGKDGRDLALELKVDFIVLVIHNRLGAINQARLLEAYTPISSTKVGFWLNDLSARDGRLTESNLSGLKALKSTLWAHHGFGEAEPDFCYAPFFN